MIQTMVIYSKIIKLKGAEMVRNQNKTGHGMGHIYPTGLIPVYQLISLVALLIFGSRGPWFKFVWGRKKLPRIILLSIVILKA